MPHGTNKPYVLNMKAGTHMWCSCGKSNKEPFCDGSHDQTGMRPKMIILEKDTKVAWCGCKISENKPYCDGSHKKS